MTYANPKEETLNLELTSYGRYLLSLGKLKPHQYAFFDEDIIYDIQFVGTGSSRPDAELQNNIEGRIQEETPRLRPQSIYRTAQVGVFSEDAAYVNNLMPGVVAASQKEASDFLLETPDSSYIFMNPIGSSAYNSNNIAAWDVSFYKAKLVSVDYAWTGSANASYTGSTTVPTTFIPQLDCDIRYKAYFYPPVPNYKDLDEIPAEIYDLVPIEAATQLSGDGLNTPYKLVDNSYTMVLGDFAMLKVEEANTEFKKENFELEVYMVTSNAVDTNPEVLERLYFSDEDGAVTNKNIEYYFDIDFDFEIDEEEFCYLQGAQDKIKNIFIDKIFNCNDTLGLGDTLVNIYGTAENQDIVDIGDVCD
jgi:hypothetical protein